MKNTCYHSLSLLSLALVLALLGTSAEALAQDRVAQLNTYDQLHYQWEFARKMDANGSTATTRATLTQAADALRAFEQANAVWLPSALERRGTAAAPLAARGEPWQPQGTVFYPSTTTPVPIPDNNPAGVTNDIIVPDGGSITDINVDVEITHTWVGDLILTLEHVDTGTTVTLLDQPGVPASTFGCTDDNMDVLFDDESAGPDLENHCSGPFPGTAPWFVGDAPPAQALSAFDGEPPTGTWRLTVSDNAGGDDGTLDAWSLYIEGVGVADLELYKDCEASTGGTGSFHLLLYNRGPDEATGIFVQDDLPAVTVAGSSGDGSFDAGTGLWDVGSLAAGNIAELWIDLTGDSGDYKNNAEVVSVNEPDPDSTPNDGTGDDYASCDLGIAPTIDLSLEKTCQASDNGTGSFHLALSNAGPDPATEVEVQDWLPEGLNITSSSGNGSFDTGSGLWDVGTVGIGSTVERWIFFTFDLDATAHYVNHAEVTEVTETDFDSTPDDGAGDDYDACGFFVYTDDRGVVPDFVPEQGASGVTERGRRFMADLRVTKTVAAESATAGTEVTYTIGLTNAGPHSTSNVSVSDVLPECLTFVSATADRSTIYDETTGLWTIGPVKVDEALKLTLVAEVGAACPETVTNTAWVSSTTLPDPPRLPDDPEAPLDDPFETPATILNNTASVSFAVESSSRELEGSRFALLENYPNPFNPETVVPFSLGASSHVSIKVYDLLGREVAVLVEGDLSAGVHEVTFEAGSLPTGVYLIRMEAAGQVAVQRVTLMK